jgi:perosamine synthetase
MVNQPQSITPSEIAEINTAKNGKDWPFSKGINMLKLAPSPKNRLYTNPSSYLLLFSYIFLRKTWQKSEYIEAFEQELCNKLVAQHAICVYQCRLGIYLAVKTLIRPGQEVILSPYTIVDVINMVIFAGGNPVFADVDLDTCNISAAEVERLITPNTGAVLITHLHGLSAAAHCIKEVCGRHQVPLIEDVAQSFGAKEQGKSVGTIGDVGVFSFEMHKNMPTWLGGAIVSDKKDLVEKIRTELKDFSYPALPGIIQKVKKGLIHDLASLPLLFQVLTYPILRFGYLNNFEFINKMVRRKPQESTPAKELPDIYKSQFTPLQARIGLSQIGNVDRDIKIRIEYAQIYHEGLRDIEQLVLPPLRTNLSHTYLWFPVLCFERNALLRFMFEQGRDIAAGHFTSTADLLQFKEFYRDCPNAKRVERELLYLPTYPRYSSSEVMKNIEVVKKYFATKTTAKPIEISPEKLQLTN